MSNLLKREDWNDRDALEKLHAELLVNAENAPRQQSASVPSARHPNENQDRVLCDPEKKTAAVFDGLGGESGGEDASNIACGCFSRYLQALDGAPEDATAARDWLFNTVLAADEAVSLSAKFTGYSYQSTTCAAVQLVGNTVLVASVGDSRVYLYSCGKLENISDDYFSPEYAEMAERLDEVDTLEELLADKELRARYSQRNIMDAALTAIAQAQPQIMEHQAQPGDIVVACTDGVSDNLTTKEMEAIVSENASASPQEIADALVNAAIARSEDKVITDDDGKYVSGHIRAKPDDITAACLVVN